MINDNIFAGEIDYHLDPPVLYTMATYMSHFMRRSKSPSCPHTVYYYSKPSLSAAAPRPYIDSDSNGDPPVPPLIFPSQQADSIAVYNEPMVLDSIMFAPASREPAISSTTIQDDGEDKYSCPSDDTHLSILDSDETALCKAHIYPV